MALPNRCLVSVVIFTIVIVGIIATASLIMGFMIAIYSPPNANNNGDNTGQGGDDGGVDSTRPPDGSYDPDHTSMLSEWGYDDPRIWLIHSGEYNHRIAYLDDETDQVRGLDIDIVNAVCRLSRKRCRMVFDAYGNCYNDGLGIGLANNYYDACAGWHVTYERQSAVVFGAQYYHAANAIWVTRPGNPSNFDPTDLTGAKIGFIVYWFANAICVDGLRNVQGLPLDDNQVLIYDNFEALVQDLGTGQIVAGFISDALLDASRIEQVGDEVRSCVAGNAGVMATPTSSGLEFIEWWNAGLNSLLSSREYGEICDRLETVHGHKDGGGKEDICLTQYL